MMQTATLDRLASVRSCVLTRDDFVKPVASRLLFPSVALTDTPATAAGLQAILNNVVHLHKWLWKDEVGVGSGSAAHVQVVPGHLGRPCQRACPSGDLRLQQHQRPELHGPRMGRHPGLHGGDPRFAFE
jgi:hypothetical protein